MHRAALRPDLASTLALAAALAVAAAAPSPARALGEPARQVLIEAAIVVVERHDGILSDLGVFKKSQRIDPATETALATATTEAGGATDAAIAALSADPLASTQEGAAALVFLSIAGAQNTRLAGLLAEEGEPKAGKVAAPARAARDLALASVAALQGRAGRFPLDNALGRSVDDYHGELLDLFPFLTAHGLPADLAALIEPFSGGPAGKLVSRAGFTPGPGMRAKVKQDELELSGEGAPPVTAGLDFDVALGPNFAVYMTLKLPPKLKPKTAERLEGFSVGLQVATDTSTDPDEVVVIEHQTTPLGFVQSFVGTKGAAPTVLPHPTPSATRELVSFLVKQDASVVAGVLLREEGGGETLLQHQVPVLGDVPALGVFFRNNDKVKVRADDLLIFVTPAVIELEESEQ